MSTTATLNAAAAAPRRMTVPAFRARKRAEPLVMLTASKARMGELVAPRWLTLVAAVIAAIIIVLNLKLIFDVATGA